MHFETAVDIDAAPGTVWNLLIDVERWPEMTASMDRVEVLDKPFALGSSARVHQPKLPTATWKVTAYEDRKGFTWESRSPGATTTATHEMTATSDTTTRVHLTLTQKGLLAPVIGAVTARLTRRYLAMEAEGLKTKAETP